MAVEPQLGGSADPGAAAMAAVHPSRLLGLEQQALAHAPVAAIAVDLDGRVVSWNRAATDVLGWEADEVVGGPVPFLPPDHADGVRHVRDVLLAGGDVTDVTFSPLHRDGERRHVVASASMLHGEHGEPVAILVFLVDITATHEAGIALAANERKWRLLLQNISDTVTVLDADGRIRETSGQFTDVLGYSTDRWQGLVSFDLLHPDDRAIAERLFREVLAEPGTERRDLLRTRHADGHYEIIEYTAVNVLHDDAVGGIVLTTRNVTDVAQAEFLMAGEAAILELIARDAPLGETLPAITEMVEEHTAGMAAILVVDETGKRIDIGGLGPSVPDALADVAVRVPVDWLGQQYRAQPDRIVRSVTDLAAAPILPTIEEHRQALLACGIGSVHVVPVAERRSAVLHGVLVVYHDRPHVPSEHEEKAMSVAGHLAAIAIDRSRVQLQLEHAAHHDALTGLPNRTAVLEHLDSALTRARSDGTPLAVLFIDLDRFKVINDSLGHAAADRVIARFAGRLATLLRPGDLVGRFAADEFVAVLEHVDSTADAIAVAHRIEQALQEPFALPEGEVYLTASIGLCRSTDASESTEVLIQQAAAALHRAKARGRNRTEVFDRDLRAQALEQVRTERDLRLAIDRLELALHYQPKVDLRTGRVVAAEALLRWHHPERGLVLPGEFVHIAEENGLIRQIGRWVLDEALRQAATWVRTVPGAEEFSISVNLSARQLMFPDLVGEVDRALRSSGFAPERLVLELTETIFIDDREIAFDALGRLKALGVRLAIDDFGTGYSSLNYLHRFPVDLVKIDRAFVTGLQPDGEGSPITSAVLHVANALGLTTCAEGVEEPGQLAGLRALGCDLAQGFLFAQPMPPADLGRLLADQPTW